MYVFHPKSFKNMLTYIIVIKEEKKMSYGFWTKIEWATLSRLCSNFKQH